MKPNGSNEFSHKRNFSIKKLSKLIKHEKDEPEPGKLKIKKSIKDRALKKLDKSVNMFSIKQKEETSKPRSLNRKTFLFAKNSKSRLKP